MIGNSGDRKKVTLRESSVVSDVTTATDASEMFYDARESPADDLSASFKRDHINSGKSPPPAVSNGWMSGNLLCWHHCTRWSIC